MKPAPFAYAVPETLDEATETLARFGAEARVLAGGQTLGPMLNMRIVTPSALVDINRVAGLDAVHETTAAVVTGATVRQRTALESPVVASRVPLLAITLKHVGHYQTRNRGTVCGSIAHADPSAELPLALLTLGGHVHLASSRGRRRVTSAAFFLGALTTAREPDELIVAVEWPAPAEPWRVAFEEISARHNHFATVACAVALRTNAAGCVVTLSVGLAGITDRPQLVDTGEHLGVLPDEAWRRAVAEHARASFHFADDVHASGRYRRQVAGVMVARCLDRALAAPHHIGLRS